MLHVRDPRIRILLVIVLVLIIGYTGYQIGLNLWANHHYQIASQALERRDYQQAGEHFAHYLSAQPTDSTARLLAAQTARRRGDLVEAERQVNLAQKHGAELEAVKQERILLRVQAGDLSDASRLADYCTEHPDGPATALILEALIEGGLRSFNQPLTRWGVELWLRHRPGNYDQAQGLLWRGRANEFGQDMPQALADYRQAVALAPDLMRARLHLAEAIIREDPQQAAPHLDWLRRARPDDVEVRLLSARSFRSLGQPEQASRLLDAILAAVPDHVLALLERGRVALDMHRPADAERWLYQALALAPENREVNVAMAECLGQLGRFEDAKRLHAKALEIEARQTQKLQEKLNSPVGAK